MKYFAAAHDPAVTTAATNAINDANRVLDRQHRGMRLALQEVVRISNPAMPLPFRRYWRSADPDDYVQLSLLSWRQWWDDAVPATGCHEPPSNFSNVSRSKSPPYNLTISPIDEFSGMWREAICSNKAAFAYRTDACNIYLIWPEYCGGAGIFPNPTDCTDNLFYLSTLTSNSLVLHEWGHWAGLLHPFAGTEGTPNALGDDDIADTPTDAWIATPLIPPILGGNYLTFHNSVSLALWGAAYQNLNTTQIDQVAVMGKIAVLKWNITAPNWPPLTTTQQAELRLIWQNLMSYHKGEPPENQWLFTEGQLDKIADVMASFNSRSSTATGRYWFFGGPITDITAPLGSSKRGFVNISAATLGNASLAAGDIVLGRPGSYPVPGPDGTTLRINKACTIRASRGNNVPGANAGSFTIYGH